jgi:hypothetical protein
VAGWRAVLWLSLTLGVVRPAPAQEVPSPPTEPGFRTAWWVNVIGLPFEYYTAEWERLAAATRLSLGVNASQLNLRRGTFTSLELKVKRYFSATLMDGIAVGVAGGLTRLEEERDGPRVSETRPTIAFIADRIWAVERWPRFAFTAGTGLKHVLGAKGDYDDLRTTYPTLRLMAGLRF